MHGSSTTLRQWLCLVGQLNWALNVYPWLKPSLDAVYAKTAGETEMWGKVKINTAIQCELTWFIEHVQCLDGVFFLKSMVWWHDDVGHSLLTIHIDALGQGLGIEFVSEKVGYQCPLPIKMPSEAIFFFEALAVCCMIHLATQFHHVTCLLIITDNTNTFDIFASFRALPIYNPILMSAIDVILEHRLYLQVFYLPGPENFVADALLQYKNDLAMTLISALNIKTFTPPWNVFGATKNDLNPCLIPAAI